MENRLHLILPMAGAGTRFFDQGYDCPKPLIRLHGKPFFYWAAKSIHGKQPLALLRFVVLKEHVERFGIDREIQSCFPEADIVVLDHVLPGAVLTCMAGVADLPLEAPVLFNDCDHLFRCAELISLCAQPQHTRPDGILLTFPSEEPKFSYLAYDSAGRVTRTVEKQVISGDAICGAYYFNRRELFSQAAERYLKNCRYNEFFMSGVYNEMIAQGQNVRGLSTQLHISFGTPEEYALAQGDPRFEELME